MSTKPYIYRVKYEEIPLKVYNLLQECLSKDYTGARITHCIEKLMTGEYQLWDLTGTHVMTTVYDYPNGAELWVVTVAGEKMMKNLAWKDQLVAVATALGCKRISGTVSRKGFGRMWKAAGAKPVATVYSLEIK